MKARFSSAISHLLLDTQGWWGRDACTVNTEIDGMGFFLDNLDFQALLEMGLRQEAHILPEAEG